MGQPASGGGGGGEHPERNPGVYSVFPVQLKSSVLRRQCDLFP